MAAWASQLNCLGYHLARGLIPSGGSAPIVRITLYFPLLTAGSDSFFYDSTDPSAAIADLGLWLWRGPAFFFSGSALLVGLGAAIWIFGGRGDKALL